MRILALLLVVCGFGVSDGALAQTGSAYRLPAHIQNRITGVEQDFERMVRDRAPQFELIREVEDFPPINGNVMDVPIGVSDNDLKNTSRPNSPPIIVTLHNRRSGKPLDSCQAPCTLQSPAVPPGMVTVYRYGSVPVNRGAEAFAFYDDAESIYVGFNEVDHQIERDRCVTEFKVIRAREMTRDAEPCVRIPPMMPSEAERSGYCRMVLNISQSGDPIDARAEECTEQVFCEPSLQSVQRWIYYPSLKYGEPEVRLGVKSKISFRLTDETGRVIPALEGELQPCVGSV